MTGKIRISDKRTYTVYQHTGSYQNDIGKIFTLTPHPDNVLYYLVEAYTSTVSSSTRIQVMATSGSAKYYPAVSNGTWNWVRVEIGQDLYLITSSYTTLYVRSIQAVCA